MKSDTIVWHSSHTDTCNTPTHAHMCTHTCMHRCTHVSHRHERIINSEDRKSDQKETIW